MSEPKRLHWIVIISNVLAAFKEVFIPFIIFLFLNKKGDDGDGLFFLFLLIGTVLFAFITGIVNWIRFSYRIEEGELRIEYGLFVRKKRYIPFERIQSLDFSEGILHRPFGLVKVTVETAGSGSTALGEGEAVLTAIKKEEALALREILQNAKSKHNGSEEEIEDKREELLYQMNGQELILLASTSGGIGVVISGLIAFLSQFGEFIEYDELFDGVKHIIANGIIFVSVLVFLVFFIAWIASIIMTMFKYANFTLKIVEDDLVISKGLLEKRQITIPLNRIQGIRISENLIRQPFGYATVSIESAGGAEMEGAKINLLPLIKKERISEVIERHIGGYDLTEAFNRAPKRALRRYYFKGAAPIIAAAAILVYFFEWWGLLSLLLLPFALLLAYFRFKDAGWAIGDNQLNLQYRFIVKHTMFMKKNKIQALGMKQSFFQRKKKLATIHAAVKSGMGQAGGEVIDLEEKDVFTIYDWFSAREKKGSLNGEISLEKPVI